MSQNALPRGEPHPSVACPHMRLAHIAVGNQQLESVIITTIRYIKRRELLAKTNPQTTITGLFPTLTYLTKW